MSDWGKFIFWTLKTMPWVVCLITAFLAFFPQAYTPEVFHDVQQDWGGWFAVLFLVSLAFSVVWVVHRIRVRKYERKRFYRLSLTMQLMLLDLYFGRTGAAEVLLKNMDVAVLRTQRYLTLCNAGMVTAEEFGPSVMVTLSERTIRLFEANEKEFKNRYEELRRG